MPLMNPWMSGSSPRGRGKPLDAVDESLDERLIPAWAGKTATTMGESLDDAAHPRVGGENFDMAVKGVTPFGSSPRGRGKHQISRSMSTEVRLIPAWAGKTDNRLEGAAHPGAHPRVGGENDASQVTQTTGPGSSPRGRGKLLGSRGGLLLRRLIPAWAGKTCRMRWPRARQGAHPRVGGENCVIWGTTNDQVGSSPRGRGKRGVRPC